MHSKDRNPWMYEEEARLTKYQHQHRGLSFDKLLLPPITDRRVNLLGRDNHVYRGCVPQVPVDQLPPGVDEASIDEEALYKEIRDMNFPPVPEQEPLGPSRRVGGEYTLAKRITLAPVYADCTQGLEETLILGRDGKLYRAKERYPSKIQLDKQLGGSKRPVQKVITTSSSRGYVEPSLVILQSSYKSVLHGKGKKPLIELPTAGLGKIVELIKEKSIKGLTDTTTQDMVTESERESDGETAKSKEIELRDETNVEEQGELETEIPVEADAEVPAEMDEEAAAESDEEEAAESDEEASTEASEEVPAEPDEEMPAETPEDVPVEAAEEASAETKEEVSTETSEKVSAEVDAEVSVETDAEASAETGEEVSAEPDAETPIETDESSVTSETKETDEE